LREGKKREKEGGEGKKKGSDSTNSSILSHPFYDMSNVWVEEHLNGKDS
jgi:hypothetical protein